MKHKTVAAVVLAIALAAPAGAHAHVSLHPNYIPAGANVTLGIRVPNEETKTNTVKVDVSVPPGFLDVSTQVIPGWSAKVLHTKLAKPVKTDAGTVTDRVSEIIWTADRTQTGIPPGSFETFPISTAMPDQNGQTLTFKAIQTYDDGTIARWIGPPSADKPAPTVYVAKKGGAIEDLAGDEAGPGSAVQTALASPASATSSAPAPRSSSAASKSLATAALIIGILGLLAGLAGTTLAVKARRTTVATK
jgi:uncharacterized protein YcnI